MNKQKNIFLQSKNSTSQFVYFAIQHPNNWVWKIDGWIESKRSNGVLYFKISTLPYEWNTL